MVMTLHKLTAGTGYDYLTRQVAAMDSTEKGHASLADYYDQKGESPGHWLGSGLAGIDGLEAGDIVTADQMLSLFGLGDHPLATERLAALTRATDRDIRDAMQLGQRYGIYSGMTDFSVELTQRISDWDTTHGRAASDPVPADVRAELRSDVGREAFRKRFGREPLDARELSGFIVRPQRPVRSGVSGYDATFSPVKSVSALWALADPRTSAVIQRCHDRAVADSLRYLEDKAIYTRRGRNGVRQVKTRGIIAAAFTHRDSRAGDPDLHTHVAIANKVQAADDGAWLAIAPAGAGKTTAMNTLGAAWREAGGEVLGTAPSAAAAAALGEQLGGHADTLHILTHGLSTGRLPGWAEQIGPRTLVVIDEAGMADTLTPRGGGVVRRRTRRERPACRGRPPARRCSGRRRAEGSRRQARCGAAHRGGAVRRPGRGGGVPRLREGRPDALGFYLDQGRVHIGDAGSTLDRAFIAWAADRASGLDTLMLAPTRELVSQLNRRAREHRLGGTSPDAEAFLCDGNRASVGDTVVTRRNERRLPFSRTGWVRNGDRWTVAGVGHDQSLTVASDRGFRVTLPADYVRADVELGYAATIHGAQGATVDTMHGVVTGDESRQQLYTMMTRG